MSKKIESVLDVITQKNIKDQAVNIALITHDSMQSYAIYERLFKDEIWTEDKFMEMMVNRENLYDLSRVLVHETMQSLKCQDMPQLQAHTDKLKPQFDEFNRLHTTLKREFVEAFEKAMDKKKAREATAV